MAGEVSAEESKPIQRPNILWITCEDISPHLGCYGDPHAHTPNIDRLARQGKRYTHAFSVAGVCAPTRSCIITGMYPTSIGTHHMRCNAVLPAKIHCFTRYLRESGYYCTNNSKTDYNFRHKKTAWDESSRKAHWRNRKDKSQPFFSVFNFTVCHEGKIRASDAAYKKLTNRLTDSQRQDPQKLTLPPYYPDTKIVRKDWARNYELITAMDYQVGDILKQLKEDGLDDSTIVFFFSDHGVGLPRAKRWLYDSGIHVPFIVRWPGTLQPGTVSNRLISFLDLAPTVLSLAKIKIPQHLQGRAFLGDKADKPREYIFAARDRMDERYDICRAVRDHRYKYIRNYEPFKPYAQYMNTPEGGPTMKELRRLKKSGKLNSVQALFMADRKPTEELYDTEKDPHEVHNLVNSPAHQQILKRLRAAHVEWTYRTVDVGLIPEPEIEQRAGQQGIYSVVRRKNQSLPIAEIRRIAALDARSSTAIIQLEKALSSPEPVIRYWAAVRCRFVKPSVRNRVIPLLAKRLTDSSSSVRIAAAHTLCTFDRVDLGLKVLVGALRHSRASVRILAANSLDELGERSRSAIPAMKTSLDDTNKYVVRVVNHALNRLEGTERKVR
ncbi:MAG: sulfatase-like hydrolase/transferase [Planctomycetaceae bacterium]